jgi:hypothetical protein
MPTLDAVFVGKITLPEVSTGPVPPGPGQPPGIWGPTDPRPTPPIYLPVVPPGLKPEHPIFIPVVPSHPIFLPGPGAPTHPIPPVIWPPQPPVTIWPSPGHPAHPIAPGGPPPTIWPSPGQPTHPIYIPVKPDKPPVEGQPEHPIYFPVYPEHPIWIQPPVDVVGGEPSHPIMIPPELPPENVTPEPGTPGFWGYSIYYSSPVYVPHIPSTGFPPPYVSTQPVPPGPEMPPAVPASRR